MFCSPFGFQTLRLEDKSEHARAGRNPVSAFFSQLKKLRDQNVLVNGGENLRFGGRRTKSNWTDAHQQVTPLQASVHSAVARGLGRHLFLAAYGT